MRFSQYLYCVIFFAISFIACKQSQIVSLENTAEVYKFQGKTMGTYYNIRYVSNHEILQKSNFDSILIALNQEVSNYIPSSTISQINSNNKPEERVSITKAPHFVANYNLSRRLYNETFFFFDPTLNPIINFWGFGYGKKAFEGKDVSKIPELLEIVSLDKWSETLEGDSVLIINKPAGASLSYSAIAKGYGVDLVARSIESQGIDNYFVDIGGEVKARGGKPNNQPWLIGINRPLENSTIDDAEVYITIKDEAVATSGNYRNFYEENGQKFSHIINPFTGMPERSNLLSATIVHKDCANADAMATACMVRGFVRSQKLIDSLHEYECLLIYAKEDGTLGTWQSKNFGSRIYE